MGVRNVQLPPATCCKAAILLRLITLLLLATEFNEPPGHRGLLKLCTFTLILWPLEQFVCFLPSDKVFKSGFNPTLGFVTQLPSIPILFYEKKRLVFFPCWPQPCCVRAACRSCMRVPTYMGACSDECESGCVLRLLTGMCDACASRAQSRVSKCLTQSHISSFLPPCHPVSLYLSWNWASCLEREVVRLIASFKESLHSRPHYPSMRIEAR